MDRVLDELELWLGPLRYVRTEAAGEDIARGINKARDALGGTGCVVVIVCLVGTIGACSLPVLVRGRHVEVCPILWCGAALFALAILPFSFHRRRRLGEAQPATPLDVFEGTLEMTPVGHFPAWARRLELVPGAKVKLHVTHRGAIVAMDGQALSRVVFASPALVVAARSTYRLTEPERIELRAIAARHSFPRVGPFLGGVVGGLLLFGVYTGFAERELFTISELHAMWLVPLVCGLVGLIVDTARRRTQAGDLVAVGERELVREGELAYLADPEGLLWRQSDIPGPRRQERGGLADTRVRKIARPLLGRPEGF